MNSYLSPISFGWGFLVIPLGLFTFKVLFPNYSKKAKRKLTAFLCNQLMSRVHLKCVQQKKALFKTLKIKNSETKKCRPDVLEFGVGAGQNLDYLPSDCSFSCLEPNSDCQPYLAQNLTNFPGIHLARFVKGFAEDMKEFEDNSFDAVVCTFTLCSVRSQQKALSEVKRVLKVGGVFLFMEHVAAPRTSFYCSVQHCLDWVWPTMCDGCHLSRETWKYVEEAGFSSVKLEHFKVDTIFVFINFGLYGCAVK